MDFLKKFWKKTIIVLKKIVEFFINVLKGIVALILFLVGLKVFFTTIFSW